MAENDKELTKIERELVLQYLRDDNVPVTVTLEEKPQANEAELSDHKTLEAEERIPASAMFPVAIPSQQLEVLNQGIILLKNVERSVQPFLGKKVRVQFYFNHVGLYFITEMKDYSQGLALVIPSSIKRVQETEYKPNYNFSGSLSYSLNDKSDVKLDCVPLNGFNLFVQPKWGDIETQYQKAAKNLLEKFVNESRNGNGASIGNGLQLLPVVKFLTDEAVFVQEAVEGKVKPLHIIYIDDKKLVLASKDNSNNLQLEEDYDITLTFILAENSMLKRTVKIKVFVENIYAGESNSGQCYVCKFQQIQQEDIRFIYERIYGNLHN